MDNEIFARLQAFIAKETHTKPQKITPEAGLEMNLGIYGDDTVELIIAFSKEFNVDVSNFIFKNYIGPEGVTFSFRETKRKDLKVSHLEKAIVAGRLDEEVINS